MTSQMGKRCRPFFGAALLWAAAAGCGGTVEGPSTVPVSGVLKVDGKPVSQGTVHFHPEKGRPAMGIVKDGQFTLTTYTQGDGGIAGKNLIAIEVAEEVATKGGDTFSKSLIAPKFANPDESGVEINIPPEGFKDLEIDVVGKAVKINK